MSITGPEGVEEPTKVGVAVVDVLTGLFASNAILAALLARSDSGTGQRVEVDLMSCLLAGLVNQASTFVTTGEVPRALGNRHPAISPYEMFSAADRHLVVAVGNRRPVCCARPSARGRVVGHRRPFASNSAGWLVGRLAALIEGRLRQRPAAEWVALLEASGVPAGLVNDIGEAFALAGSLGLSPVAYVGDRGAGDEIAQVADPMRLEASPVTYRRRPPRLGEHTDEVLRELDA